MKILANTRVISSVERQARLLEITDVMIRLGLFSNVDAKINLLRHKKGVYKSLLLKLPRLDMPDDILLTLETINDINRELNMLLDIKEQSRDFVTTLYN